MSEYCGQMTNHVKRRGKIHACGWCGQAVEVGERYTKWLYFDGNSRDTVYAHHECGVAWMDDARAEGGICYADGDQDRPAPEEAS